MFPNEVQIPGSNLDFDLFLGDYSKNVHGFHRDGANISFVYTKKTFNFWKFEVLEAEADKHALSHKKRAAFASGSFFFPKEMRKTLHEKYNDQKQSINLKDGDLLYWPTSSWHTADNLKQDVTFILNITLYKSNLLSINHSILSSLEQQELESKFELGSGFIPIEVADNETQRELFIEDEANKVLASLSQIKRIYSESREIFYSRFLSSFGIQNKFLKLMPINQCINIKNITLKKPLVFKIVTKLDKNLILNLYYFGSSVKIPNCSGAIEIINFINSSKSFCYQDLIDLYPDRKDLSKISYKIIAFLTKTPGVEI